MANERTGRLLGLVVLSSPSRSLHLSREGQPPQGFAAYRELWQDWFELRAVSPDGVVYRVRTEDNEPTADLPFWQAALKKRMLDAGYILVAESETKAGKQPGYLLELAAPVGQEDFVYLIALFVNGSELGDGRGGRRGDEVPGPPAGGDGRDRQPRSVRLRRPI